MPITFDKDCPFTEEEVAKLNEIAYAPLDYEIQAIREQEEDGKYLHKSVQDKIREAMEKAKELL
jgi:hypothetical protein